MLGFDINISRYRYFDNDHLRTYIYNIGERSDVFEGSEEIGKCKETSCLFKKLKGSKQLMHEATDWGPVSKCRLSKVKLLH